jgi:hypothetical protein
VRFEPASTLDLAPRQERQIIVVVSPARAHEVHFALLGAHDAALDRSSLVTDVTGRGSVRLTAPSVPAEFSLQAQAGSVSARLAVSVAARAFTSVEVVPRYTGRRPVTEWVASVHTAPLRCASFTAIPRDAELYARIAADKTAMITNVPLEKALAVTMRTGQFAGGCVDVPPRSSGGSFRVEVPVVDRPLELERTSLDIAFGIGQHDPTFVAALAAGLSAVNSAFLGGNASDGSALLDAMELELKQSLRPVFRTARADLGWDGAPAVKNGRPSRLTETITRWVTAGQSALFSQRAFEGHLSSDPANWMAPPILRADRIAELDAESVTAEVSDTSWMADATDTLAFSGTLEWHQGELVTSLAEAPALAEAGAPDVASALASIVDCTALGSELLRGSVTSVTTLASYCDAACLASACRSALATRWERARAVDQKASLTVYATGAATIGNQAQAVEMAGNWVGKLTLGSAVGDTGGNVRGAAPRYTAR